MSTITSGITGKAVKINTISLAHWDETEKTIAFLCNEEDDTSMQEHTYDAKNLTTFFNLLNGNDATCHILTKTPERQQTIYHTNQLKAWTYKPETGDIIAMLNNQYAGYECVTIDPQQSSTLKRNLGEPMTYKNFTHLQKQKEEELRTKVSQGTLYQPAATQQ